MEYIEDYCPVSNNTEQNTNQNIHNKIKDLVYKQQTTINTLQIILDQISLLDMPK